jgi:triosephosphate isomerase
MRKQIAAANWKMNLTFTQAKDLLEEVLLNDQDLGADQLAIFAVPFPYLLMAEKVVRGQKNYGIASQNCYFQKAGAYTGEVSAGMLSSIGVTHVIIGHSERREYFNENQLMLANKVNLCLEENLKPIFCCGEPLSVRESGSQNGYVENQLAESLFHLDGDALTDFIIAYEPIWAIGTGKTASSDQAQEMHQHIRKVMADKYGDKVADSISILYGGSVKAANAKEIFGQPDVDGGLVGGASLVAAEFITIIQSLK